MISEITPNDSSPNAAPPDGFALSVVVPAYNEQEGIRMVIADLQEVLRSLDVPSEIVVVDDGSTDSTAAVLFEMGNTVDDGQVAIRLLKHPANLGYGAAIKSGVKQAQYDWICITDADGTYPNHRIPDLARSTGEFDMVVGARTKKGVRISMIRKPVKWCLTRLAVYLTQRRIPDLNSGLRIIKKDRIRDFQHILPDGFSFTTTITLAMLTNHHQVSWVPISYADRKGRSKIRPIYDTLNFIQLIIRMVLYFNPLRVFLPMSVMLFGIASLLLLYRIFVAQAFGTTIVILFVSAFQMLAIGMLADLIDKRMK